jgi:hypothetical protein
VWRTESYKVRPDQQPLSPLFMSGPAAISGGARLLYHRMERALSRTGQAGQGGQGIAMVALHSCPAVEEVWGPMHLRFSWPSGEDQAASRGEQKLGQLLHPTLLQATSCLRALC